MPMQSFTEPSVGLLNLLLWSFLATAALTVILQSGQGIGLSRLSLPFIVGTFFTGNRHRAVVVGASVYVLGGWLFAAFYYLVFVSLGFASWWLGTALGILHSAALLTVVLPLLAHLHPRMASEYDGPTFERRLEPPGFLGLNYGTGTPIVTILGHALYGGILGGALSG